MRIIITGATGFIGTPLVRALVEDGYEVVALTRSRKKGEKTFGDRVQVASWDGKSAEGWGHIADGAYAIVNLAGENIGAGRWTQARKQAILDSRLNAAEAVVEAVERAAVKPKVLLQGSGIGIYGDTGERAADENSPAGKGFLADLAVRWESAVNPVKDHQVRLILLRTSAVLGRGGALGKMLPLFRAGLGGPLGSGNQYFPWIHLDDEIGAIRFLLKKEDASGPFNLVAPQNLRQKEFAKFLGRALKRPAIMPAPAFMMKLVLGQMADELLLFGQKAIPQKLLDTGFEFKYQDLASALKNVLV